MQIISSLAKKVSVQYSNKVPIRYSTPNAMVYHSKYAFQILWKIKILISFSDYT